MTSRRRRWVRVLLLLTVPPLLFALWLWLRPDPLGTFTRGNFDRVKLGMTRQDVQVILGPDAGLGKRNSFIDWGYDYWEGWDATGFVGYGDGAIVAEKEIVEKPWRRRLHELWCRWFDESSSPF